MRLGVSVRLGFGRRLPEHAAEGARGLIMDDVIHRSAGADDSDDDTDRDLERSVVRLLVAAMKSGQTRPQYEFGLPGVKGPQHAGERPPQKEHGASILPHPHAQL